MNIDPLKANLCTSLASCNLLLMLNYNKFLKSNEYKNNYFTDKNNFNAYILDKVGIGNQSIMVMMLYALLVLPKEQLPRDSYYLDQINKTIKMFCTKHAKVIKTSYKGEDKNNKSTIKFHDHMRNALAHGRMNFSKQKIVEFSDKRRGEENVFKLFTKDIGILVKELSEIIAKYINDEST